MMPSEASYDEAIKLARTRLRIRDDDLKYGRAVTVQRNNPRNPGKPIELLAANRGGFANVYKFQTRSQQTKALRCSREHINPDMQFRYERFSTFFHTHVPDFTIDFRYYEDGIDVEVPDERGGMVRKPYPVVVMDWVEGKILLDKLDELCKRRDYSGLENLSNRWLHILRTMRQVNMAHGDLSGENVMVRDDGRLVLIDYDSVYIPDLKGLSPIVAGQPDYQHPNMHQRPFDEQMDGFSALVIATVLLALQVQPELWDKYVERNQQGKLKNINLLFVQNDFKQPDRSALFADLERMSDPRVKRAVQELKEACYKPVGAWTLPVSVFESPEQLGLRELEKAVYANDDRWISRLWVSPLDSYAPAQQHQSRVLLAKQRLQALDLFQKAVKTHEVMRIVNAYDPILDTCKDVTKEERELVSLAQSFSQACHTDGDLALVDAWEEIQHSQHRSAFMLTSHEQQRLDLARKRENALTILRAALRSRNIQRVAKAYDPILDMCKEVTSNERENVRLASEFMQAYETDNDEALIAVFDAIQAFRPHPSITFTTQEQLRMSLARQRINALKKFREALKTQSAEQIVQAYKLILDDCTSVKPGERLRLKLARNLLTAFRSDNDEAIVKAYSEIQNSQYSFTFTTQQEQHIKQAQDRQKALEELHSVLNTHSAQHIAKAYNPILDAYRGVTREERELLRMALNFTRAYQTDDDIALVEAWEEMQRPQHQNFFMFTAQEQQRINLARQRKDALLKFRQTCRHSKNAQAILASYDRILDTCNSITENEQNLLQSAHSYITMYKAVSEALTENDKQRRINKILVVYNEKLANKFTDFKEEQTSKQAEVIFKQDVLKQALDRKDYGVALRAAEDIGRLTREPIGYESQRKALSQAAQEFIKQFQPKDLQLRLQKGQVFASWKWPLDKLIKFTIVTWRYDTWPQPPDMMKPGTLSRLVHRDNYKRLDGFLFELAPHTKQVYVQVYLAVLDDMDSSQEPQWFYSSGDEPTSRRMLTI